MIKILITGAGGFIGNHLFCFLKKNKKLKVYGTINNSNKIRKKKIKPKNLSNNIFKVDLSDSNQVKKLFHKIKPSIIFHFAAMADHAYAEKNKILCKRSNSIITRNIINYTSNENKIIFLSTDKIYSQNPKKSPEHTTLAPNGYLANEKLKCEKMIKRKIKKHFILRLPIVHSRGESKNFSIIDNFLFLLKKNKKISVFKNVKRSFLKIDEFNKLLEKLIYSENYGIYNIGRKVFSYSKRLEMLCKKYSISKKNIRTIAGNIKPLIQNFDTKKVKKKFNIVFS